MKLIPVLTEVSFVKSNSLYSCQIEKKEVVAWKNAKKNNKQESSF